MAYDDEAARPGKAEEIAAIAYAAAKAATVDGGKAFIVNDQDPSNKYQCPLGNTEDADFKKR